MLRVLKREILKADLNKNWETHEEHECAAPVHEDHIKPENPSNYLRSALLTISAFTFANLMGCLLLYLLY